MGNVYGLKPKQTHLLRTFQDGKLKSQIINGEEYPPFYYEDPEQGRVKPEFEGLYEPLNDEKRLLPELKAKLFAMGVERANVHIGYVILNVICLREHNRLCDLLAKNYGDRYEVVAWGKEQKFELKPSETVYFASNAQTHLYDNNNGIITLNWSYSFVPD